MSDKVKVRLLKPLDGMAEGSPAEFDAHEIPALEAMGAVKVEAAERAPAQAPAKKPGKPA